MSQNLQDAARFHSLLDDDGSRLSGIAAAEVIALAEQLLKAEAGESVTSESWRRYLDVTGRVVFLRELPDRDHCSRWAETAFEAILRSNYSLEFLLADRVRRHPDRILLREASGDTRSTWSYAQVARRLRILAGLFCLTDHDPRVAIFCENGIDSACCDLACLTHRIFDTPLNVHYDLQSLIRIFDRLQINIAVADSDDRLALLAEVRDRAKNPFRIFAAGSTGNSAGRLPPAVELLQEACARCDIEKLEAVLAPRRSTPLSDVATVMFTSGSTGIPKGIAFTHYHIIAKRLARAAALPTVGDGEVLLCYLPLFHTFGRYLEMLGSIYWGGTYVFAGNPSVETLISELRQVRPTGLISVPLRWTQIRDFCLESTGDAAAGPAQDAVFRSIVGDRLRWGLSAAGYLDPGVFRFFQRQGVDLCSGFGMTEATGGVTMTPPGEYVDGTVGVPLPGMHIRLAQTGELEIAGPYVARYLADTDEPKLPPQEPHGDYWMPTGDLFRMRENGHLEIVDRIKDIYKNNRGQTIAPRHVEHKFDGVAGIKRTFLVGDRRDSNVLLIVPDRGDKVFRSPGGSVREYFHQIVAAANAELAPYERAVNFAVLERDFDPALGEVTAKGSLHRKAIEDHFSVVIEKLYQGSHVDLRCGNLEVRIPRWFFRDLGLLENDIEVTGCELRRPGTRRLTIAASETPGSVLIGDLEYLLSGFVVDLGLFARQPKLWAGNAALAAFCPCKDGWDMPMEAALAQVRLPWRSAESAPAADIEFAPSLRDSRLRNIHLLCMAALFGPLNVALAAVGKLGEELQTADERRATLIRRRLEALARHPSEEVRCLAYRVLLADEPMPDYGKVFPAFVESGLSFLNEASIRAIADAGLGDRQLQALRRRLAGYRRQLNWPASDVTSEQFERIFDILANLARKDLSFVSAVRAELAGWVLHREDPRLAAAAEHQLSSLNQWLDSTISSPGGSGSIEAKVVYSNNLSSNAALRLAVILSDPSFLKQSLLLAFDEGDFEIDQVVDAGIWISPIAAQQPFELCRAGINLRNGKHYDLLIVLGNELATAEACDTVSWLMALADHPTQARVLPRLGVCRPDLSAMSVAYVSDLTVWEKIREYAVAGTVRPAAPERHEWRRLFVRGMAAFFSAWKISGARIVPGAVSPENVAVPDLDFREGALILSLSGWQTYNSPRDLVSSLARNFYNQTKANYPQVARQLELRWIFDACMEALGQEDGGRFLAQLESDELNLEPAAGDHELPAALTEYCKQLAAGPYLPLPLLCAIERYAEWEHANPQATPDAREEEVLQVYRLYRIGRYPEQLRYHLYRKTFFSRAVPEVDAAFERLLRRLFREPELPAINLEELSDLQSVLSVRMDREVFSRMVFPRAQAAQQLELVAVGAVGHKQVFVRSEIQDRRGARYTVREPASPAEIGRLYSLLRDADYPKPVSEQERHLVVADELNQVLGGLTYVLQETEAVYLNGLVIETPRRGQGLASALLDDFCVRMQARGIRRVKTDFFLRRFYAANGFDVDQRSAGLVRHLAIP